MAPDFKYMKSLRIHLKVINAWPGDEVDGIQSKNKIYINIFLFLLNLFCISSSMHYMISHWDTLNFFELGHMYVVFLVIINTMVRIFNIITYMMFLRWMEKVFVVRFYAA